MAANEATLNGFGANEPAGILSEKLMGAFDGVIKEREGYYAANPAQIPSQYAVDQIISSACNKNMVISGGVSLIPGPWGMAAAVPELVMVIRNQLTMIYDIGKAYGNNTNVLQKELIAGILVASTGQLGGGILVMQGSRILVRRASLRVFQKIVQLLAGRVTQQLLKSMVAKWIPVAGAVAMGAWARHLTNKIGQQAKDIFAKDIQLDTVEITETGERPIAQATAQSISAPAQEQISQTSIEDVNAQKLKVLVNLMKVDGVTDERERGYILPLIESLNLRDEVRGALLRSLRDGERPTVEYATIKKYPDEIIPLLVDMAALIKIDGKVHPAEKMYMKQIGKEFGVSDTDIEEILTM